MSLHGCEPENRALCSVQCRPDGPGARWCVRAVPPCLGSEDRRKVAREMDKLAVRNATERSKPTHFTQIRIDPKEQEERFIESEFERLLQREADRR